MEDIYMLYNEKKDLFNSLNEQFKRKRRTTSGLGSGGVYCLLDIKKDEGVKWLFQPEIREIVSLVYKIKQVNGQLTSQVNPALKEKISSQNKLIEEIRGIFGDKTERTIIIDKNIRGVIELIERVMELIEEELKAVENLIYEYRSQTAERLKRLNELLKQVTDRFAIENKVFYNIDHKPLLRFLLSMGFVDEFIIKKIELEPSKYRVYLRIEDQKPKIFFMKIGSEGEIEEQYKLYNFLEKIDSFYKEIERYMSKSDKIGHFFLVEFFRGYTTLDVKLTKSNDEQLIKIVKKLVSLVYTIHGKKYVIDGNLSNFLVDEGCERIIPVDILDKSIIAGTSISNRQFKEFERIKTDISTYAQSSGHITHKETTLNQIMHLFNL